MLRHLLPAFLLFAAACQAPTSAPEPTVLSNEITATGQVVGVESIGRTVTLRDADGVVFDVVAGPEVVNFDQIEPGDALRIRFRERLAAALRPADESATPMSGALAAGVAAPGAKPGAGVGVSVSLRVKIESIDLENDIVVFSGARGELVAHRLATDEGRTFVGGLKLGDIVQLDYERALAISIEEL